jgi:hypothetical protein
LSYNNTYSQNFDWDDFGYYYYRNERFPVKEQTTGSKHIYYSYQMNPESCDIKVDVDFPAERVERFHKDYKNLDILSTTMTEVGGKTTKFNVQHVVKNSGNYSLINYRTHDNKNYVGPVIESTQTNYDGKEFESTTI